MKHNSIRQMWQALRVFMLLFACCVSSIAWGQGTNSVKGHITDGNGEPLIGVSILVKHTNNGTVSDLDGNFTLSVNPGDILRVTYVGYASQEIPAVSGKIMRIVLKEREFDIRLENRQLSVIDKIYINGGLLLKKAVCCNSRQGICNEVVKRAMS